MDGGKRAITGYHARWLTLAAGEHSHAFAQAGPVHCEDNPFGVGEHDLQICRPGGIMPR